MKILILLKKYEGGVGTVVKHISKDLESLGHEVKVISREDDLKIFSLKKSILPIRRLVKKAFEKDNYDIVYTQDWSLAFPLLFPYSIFKKKRFCVFYGTDVGFGRKLQGFVGGRMGNHLIVCNDDLKKRFSNANLIYNRVDLDRFKPNSKIKRIKNSVGFANWTTDEYSYEKIKNSVERAGKKFIVAAGLPKEKMPEFYNKIEMFISLPPSYAGFGLVYLEAMASGVPKIVGSRYGGGKILPIEKIEDYKSIEETLNKATKKDYRKWVVDNKFTWKDAANKLIDTFQKSKN